MAHKAAQAHDFRGKLLFDREDEVVEPFHQGHVVGEAAQKGHGGVGVRVDKPRQQHALPNVNLLLRLPAGCHFVARANVRHKAVKYRHAGVFKNSTLFVLGDNESGVNKCMARTHGNSHDDVCKKILYPCRAGDGKAGHATGEEDSNRRVIYFYSRIIDCCDPFFLYAASCRRAVTSFTTGEDRRFAARGAAEKLARLNANVYRNSLVLCANRL